jgi:hypothetical protein
MSEHKIRWITKQVDADKVTKLFDSLDFLPPWRYVNGYCGWKYGKFHLYMGGNGHLNIVDESNDFDRVPFVELLEYMEPEHQEELLFHLDLFT